MSEQPNQELQSLISEFDHMIQRAERNAQLFQGVAWQAELEILQDDDLPHLLTQQGLIQENMQIFAAYPDELNRLEDCAETVKRKIAHLQSRRAKKGKSS